MSWGMSITDITEKAQVKVAYQQGKPIGFVSRSIGYNNWLYV